MDGQEGFFKMEANLAPKESAAPKGHRRYTPRLNEDVPYDEVVSGLQKMIRRGKEKEALVFGLTLYQNRFGGALARRLMIIAAEDIGLANPQLVSQVYNICTGWLLSKKEASSGYVEFLPLSMCILMLCRSPKNREADDAQYLVGIWIKKGVIDATKVIEENHSLIVDGHTERGKTELRRLAAANATNFEEEHVKRFFTNGAKLLRGVEVEGNPWGRELAKELGFGYEGYLRGYAAENIPQTSEINGQP